MIFAHSDVLSRIVNSTSLTHEDIASFGNLSAEQFHA